MNTTARNSLRAAAITIGLVAAAPAFAASDAVTTGPQIAEVVPAARVATKPFNLASKIVGAPVFIIGDEQVGTVSDIVLDDAHDMVGITVDVGEYVGVGGTTVAIPASEITWSEKDGDLQIVTSLAASDIHEALAN
ncbi:MAG: PRC-barrel domain-containing protein [Hyphomicrobiales bacterium]